MKPSRGFSLVELLVALAIGLLIVLALSIIIVRASGNQRELALANRQLENGRYAMQVLSDELHNAGYVGAIANLPVLSPSPTVPDFCSPAWYSSYANVVGIGAFPVVNPSCIDPADQAANSDILAIVHASSLPSTATAGTLVPNVAYIQTDTQQFRIGINGGAFVLKKKDGVTPAELRELQLRIYYVSPCSQPPGCGSSGKDTIPTLRRKIIGGAQAGDEAIAEGVERLQVYFGIDTVSKDGAPDAFKPIENVAASELVDVVAASVHLLARNTEATSGYTDDKTYYLGLGATGTVAASVPPDSFRRHVFSRVIRLNNASGRREGS